MDLIRPVLIAALCIALAVLAARRWGRPASFQWRPRASPPHLELLQRLPLTPQHSLHLVRVAGRDLLIAAHNHGVTLVQGPRDAASSQEES